MKKHTTILMSVIGTVLGATSAFAGEEFDEFATVKSCDEVASVVQSCTVEMARDLGRKILGMEFEKYEFVYGWVNAKFKDGSRKATFSIYPRDIGSSSESTGSEANFRINVKNIENFKGNPYISRKSTSLDLYMFPTARCYTRTSVTSRDSLGNPTSLNSENYVSVINLNNTDGLIKNSTFASVWTSAYTVPGLNYDPQAFIQCVKSGL